MIPHQNKILRPLIIAGLIALITCAVMLILLSINGFKDGVFSKKATAEEDFSLPSRLQKTPDYGQFYVDNMIFIGDQTIVPIRSSAILRDGADTKQIWTGEKGSLSLDYSLSTSTIVYPESAQSITLSEAISLKRPDHVIITLGFENGVAYCTEEKFKEYYGSLISVIKESSPDTKIILQSIFPVSDKKQKDDSGITNEKIDRANLWIEELANDNSVRYLHTASVLKDSKGNLNSDYDSGNGVTLNEAGYRKMIEYIRTHGYK